MPKHILINIPRCLKYAAIGGLFAVGAGIGNATAAGYTCDPASYVSCAADYYLSTCTNLTDGVAAPAPAAGQVVTCNKCNQYQDCSGGQTCPKSFNTTITFKKYFFNYEDRGNESLAHKIPGRFTVDTTAANHLNPDVNNENNSDSTFTCVAGTTVKLPTGFSNSNEYGTFVGFSKYQDDDLQKYDAGAEITCPANNATYYVLVKSSAKFHFKNYVGDNNIGTDVNLQGAGSLAACADSSSPNCNMVGYLTHAATADGESWDCYYGANIGLPAYTDAQMFGHGGTKYTIKPNNNGTTDTLSEIPNQNWRTSLTATDTVKNAVCGENTDFWVPAYMPIYLYTATIDGTLGNASGNTFVQMNGVTGKSAASKQLWCMYSGDNVSVNLPATNNLSKRNYTYVDNMWGETASSATGVTQIACNANAGFAGSESTELAGFNNVYTAIRKAVEGQILLMNNVSGVSQSFFAISIDNDELSTTSIDFSGFHTGSKWLLRNTILGFFTQPDGGDMYVNSSGQVLNTDSLLNLFSTSAEDNGSRKTLKLYAHWQPCENLCANKSDSISCQIQVDVNTCIYIPHCAAGYYILNGDSWDATCTVCPKDSYCPDRTDGTTAQLCPKDPENDNQRGYTTGTGAKSAAECLSTRIKEEETGTTQQECRYTE